MAATFVNMDFGSGGEKDKPFVVGRYMTVKAGTLAIPNIPIEIISDGKSHTNRVESLTYSSGKITANSTDAGKFHIVITKNNAIDKDEVVELSSSGEILSYSTTSGALTGVIIIDITDWDK